MSRLLASIQRVAGAVLLAAMLLAASAPPPAQGQEATSQFRSVNDARRRLPDEHDRPYFRETQSHRGFEVRDERFTVIATTSRDDARWAAAQVTQAWQNSARLSRHWTNVAEDPDFGLQSLQVVVSDEPIRDRDAPLTTVNVVGIRTQVHVNIAPGQPPLMQQKVRLREAAAFGMLHAAGLDSAAPPWVVAGVAAFAGRQGLSDEEQESADSERSGAEFGGQQWRFPRTASDVLDYRRIDQSEARQRIAFLLTGDDAEHAPALFAELKRANASAASGAAQGGFDRLMAGLQSAYESWKVQPLGKQPIHAPTADAAPEQIAAEQEMIVLLKLQRRFAAGGSAIAKGTKVVTFDRQKGAVVTPVKRTTAPASFASLVARLSDPAQPAWVTLDTHGTLLLSSDHERIAKLLGTESQYRFDEQKGKTILARQLDAFHTLCGWLEENPDDKTRPLAKFEVVDRRQKAQSNAGLTR